MGRPAQNTCIDLPHGTDLNFGGVMTGRWVGRWMNVHCACCWIFGNQFDISRMSFVKRQKTFEGFVKSCHVEMLSPSSKESDDLKPPVETLVQLEIWLARYSRQRKAEKRAMSCSFSKWKSKYFKWYIM